MTIYTAHTNDYVKTIKLDGNKITTGKWSLDGDIVSTVKLYERTVSYSSVKVAKRIANDKWFDTCRQAEKDGVVALKVVEY